MENSWIILKKTNNVQIQKRDINNFYSEYAIITEPSSIETNITFHTANDIIYSHLTYARLGYATSSNIFLHSKRIDKILINGNTVWEDEKFLLTQQFNNKINSYIND